MPHPRFNRYSDPRKTCVFDIECFRNYWAIAFRCVETGQQRRFEKYNDSPLDTKGIAKVIFNWRIVGFNSSGYDLSMLALAMSGAKNGELKRASDSIILADLRPWQFEELYQVSMPDYTDHIDLMEVSPGSPQKPSLKMYAGRLHYKRMRDLPFDPDMVIDDDDLQIVREYHDNDLGVTRDFFYELKPQIDIRCQISDQYGVDVRSKSDAQIAEAVITAELERELQRKVYKPEVKATVFHYAPPPWIKFQTKQMQDVLQNIIDTPFVVDQSGIVEIPKSLSDLKISIGKGVYRMGIGGLHSSESSASHYSDDEFVLLDRDVTSFYPWLIILMGLFPKQFGPIFLQILKSILERRVKAKKAGDKNLAETLKIVVNGCFGKFGSPFSKLYAPNLMIQTTVTGQLAILMKIEELEVFRGMQVISANTDGFVTKVPRHRRAEFEAVILDWQWDTGLMTEETEYRSLHSRDVNSYIAISSDGKVKLKGALSLGGPGQPAAMGMKKNPTNEVCIDAVIAYLKDGVPLMKTIQACSDIRRFVCVRRVNGGAVKDGEPVGKVIRFYYSTETAGVIQYAKNGNSVPKTEGAKPLMELCDEFPDDVDYAWYEREATAMLADIGIATLDPALAGRKGHMIAKLGDQITYHAVHLPSGIAKCGKTPGSIREKWLEVGSVPNGSRMCSKCRKVDEL